MWHRRFFFLQSNSFVHMNVIVSFIFRTRKGSTCPHSKIKSPVVWSNTQVQWGLFEASLPAASALLSARKSRVDLISFFTAGPSTGWVFIEKWLIVLKFVFFHPQRENLANSCTVFNCRKIWLWGNRLTTNSLYLNFLSSKCVLMCDAELCQIVNDLLWFLGFACSLN